MALDKNNLNSVYALGKDKKTGEWQVGQWINQALWSVDNSNKRICAYKEMTRWRFFRESAEYSSEVPLAAGDRVSLPNKRGTNEWYYVLYLVSSVDGKSNYVVGI